MQSAQNVISYILLTLLMMVSMLLLYVGDVAPLPEIRASTAEEPPAPYVMVLGIAQDAGYPQAACKKNCCAAAWQQRSLRRHATSIAIIDPQSRQRWLIEATPDFKLQLKMLDNIFEVSPAPGLEGIFLTHAHIGHYTGLMHLGRETLSAASVPVYAMPRMKTFLERNGPWEQLVRLKNISLKALSDRQSLKLNDRLSISPFLVPHRDEYSETVGYRIQGPQKSLIFIPDIDKWERWEQPIEDLITANDYALLDATFYADGEIPGRDMAEIPHPFISESMSRFEKMPSAEKSKIRFIHLNHTNPALQPGSPARKLIQRKGYKVAREGEKLEL